MGTEFFLHHPVIGLLSNLPVLAGAILMLLVDWTPFRKRLDRRPGAWLWGTFVVTRLVFLLLIVVALGHVSLDLSTYFQAQGEAIRAGRLPYRDFTTSYSPLFAYLMALPTAMPGGSLPLFLFFIACDAGALLLLQELARNRVGPDRVAAVGWLYVAAPVTWYFLVRYAQDEALGSLMLMAATLLSAGGREGLGATAAAIGFATTKFTFGLFVPPLALGARRPFRYLILTGLAVALLFLPFVVAGAPVWRPLFSESSGIGFGPSIWRLPVVFTPLRLGWWSSLVLGVGLLLLWLPGTRGRRRSSASWTLASGLLFLILSPKVMPMYITPFWGLAALWLVASGTAADRRRAALLNLLLGVWWYLDAGGITGDFGVITQSVAVLVTALIPILLAFWLREIVGRSDPAPAGSTP